MPHLKTFCVILVVVALLLTAGSSAVTHAAALSASIMRGSEIIVSERDSDEFSPDIAYNSLHDEYLVVWENMWGFGGHHDIYAQRISSSGRVLSWFAVSVLTNKQKNPSVAYDRINDRYLVVYSYDYNGDETDWDIYGRFIPWNGPDIAYPDFMICNWTTNQFRPVTAYAYTQQEFLVTWTDAPAAQPTQISARRVYANGSGFPGGPFLLSSGTYDRDYQDVTYNLARNEYLVTWDVDTADGDLDIAGIRLTGSGTALTGGDPLVTGEFNIAGWPAQEERPTVAACNLADQYLVAWQSDQETNFADEAIYARYLNGDAVPGNVYLVVDTTSPQEQVDIGCSNLGQNYLIAWQDKYVGGEYGIWGRLAYPNEIFSTDFEIAGPRSMADRGFPAVAGGKGPFLVAWQHDRDGGTNIDIHGRLVGYAVFVPLVRRP